MTVAPYLRDLVDALWEKFIFGHWVAATIRHGGEAEGVRMVKRV
jgi:hypothetical protein